LPLQAQLPGLSLTLPLCIFGSLALAAGFLALFLPETLFAKMQQTIEEAEEANLDYSVPCCGKPSKAHKFVPLPLTEKENLEYKVVETVSTV
jgi:hypothetical protein